MANMLELILLICRVEVRNNNNEHASFSQRLILHRLILINFILSYCYCHILMFLSYFKPSFFFFVGATERVYFLASKLFLYGNRVKDSLRDYSELEEGSELFFDAVPCNEKDNDHKCVWFATVVWCGPKKPYVEYDAVGTSVEKFKTNDLLSQIKMVSYFIKILLNILLFEFVIFQLHCLICVHSLTREVPGSIPGASTICIVRECVIFNTPVY